MGSVFLTDAQQRKTLAAARSLGRKGVFVAAGEETRMATALFSRYCRRSLVYPSPRLRPERFLGVLLEFLHRNPFDVLFPMDDLTLELIAGHKSEFEAVTRLPVPDHDTLILGADKARTLERAWEMGLACPKTWTVDRLEQVEDRAASLSFPVVIKPRRSSGSRGIRYAPSREGFVSTYLEVHKRYPFPLIQEFIPPGEKYDVCLLFNRESRLRGAFVQKELREYPLTGGPSTLQESVRRPDLVEQAAALMQGMGWYGVCEVEFMVDPRRGEPVLMEVNPRFWASLQLAIDSGIDFPYLLHQMAISGDIKPVFRYEVGRRCRWLLPGDILHFLANPKRWRMNPGFFNFWDAGTKDDIISLADPGPTIGFCLACFRYVLDLRMWKFIVTRS